MFKTKFKRGLLSLTAGALLLNTGSAFAADYAIDKQGQHAFVQFRIQHLGFSWVYGTFKDFNGTFSYDKDDASKNKVDIVIETGSVDTNHAERDKHIRSADFFNSSQYPQAKYTSTDITKQGSEYLINGDLTFNGVTKPVALTAKLMGEGNDPWKGYRAGFEATGKVNLKEFNIKSDLGPKAQEAEIIISLEGVRKS